MMKELLAVEQELQEIQEECNKREIEYQSELKAAIDNEEEANSRRKRKGYLYKYRQTTQRV